MLPPTARREPERRDLVEDCSLLVGESCVRIAAATRLERVGDRGQLIAEHPETEHHRPLVARDRVRCAGHHRYRAVPHARGVLDPSQGLVRPAAGTIEVAAHRRVGAIHLGGDDPRVLGRCRVRPEAAEGRVDRHATGVVRGHDVRPVRDRERDRFGGRTLLRHRRVCVLEEPPAVVRRSREVEREACLGTGETTVHVPIRDGDSRRRIGRRPLLVPVDVRLRELRIDIVRGDQHAQTVTTSKCPSVAGALAGQRSIGFRNQRFSSTSRRLFQPPSVRTRS